MACNAATIEERVVGLADGDTVTVLDASKVQHKIRLSGIDAPEKNQACRGHERLLTGVELDNRNAASGERQQRVFRSQPTFSETNRQNRASGLENFVDPVGSVKRRSPRSASG